MRLAQPRATVCVALCANPIIEIIILNRQSVYGVSQRDFDECKKVMEYNFLECKKKQRNANSLKYNKPSMADSIYYKPIDLGSGPKHFSLFYSNDHSRLEAQRKPHAYFL